jgi:hypothetical protein
MGTQGKAARLVGNTNFRMAVVVLLVGVANVLWAERLTINEGLGWDGLIYAGWVRDFQGVVLTHGVPDYYAGRVLPSAIVHYGMRLFSVPFDSRSIVLAFDVYNLILLVISAYVWGLAADKLNIGDRGKWLGFCFLFLNYANLKQSFYGPVQTDVSAFALGVLTLYFFLTDSRVGLPLVMLLGAFTWPTVAPTAAILYVLPYRGKSYAGPHTDASTPPPDKAVTLSSAKAASPPPYKTTTPPYRLNIIIAAMVSGLTLVMLVYLTWSRLAERVAYYPRALRIDTSLLYLSIAAVPVFLFFGLRAALADASLFDPRRLFASVSWARVAVVLPVFIIAKIIQNRLWSGESIAWGGPKSFFIYTLLSSVAEPLIFVVAHVVYFGPCILLLLFFWRRFCEAVGSYGVGLRIVLILNLLLAVNPQTRYQVNVLALFVAVLVTILDGAAHGFRGLRGLLCWALVCLFYSKEWYVFNTAPQVDDGTMEVLLRFPLQHMFMSIGPWMSKEMYLVQAGVVALTATLIYFAVVRRRAVGPA